MKRIFTNGNVEVQNIKIGDIHYEYDGFGCFTKARVLTEPRKSEENTGWWEWESENLLTGEKIDYGVREDIPTRYSISLYDYEAYLGCRQV